MLREILLAKCTSMAMEPQGKESEGALKFSVSNKGELFYRQKRKGKASIFCMYISIAICELTIHN